MESLRHRREVRRRGAARDRARLPRRGPARRAGREELDVATAPRARPRLGAVLRQEERVTPLELFFDLVFVLAITQCTALMAAQPTWEGLAKGLLVLGVLWWCWVGYAWLTSVVDPEEGMVRLAIFAAMAGLLVAALCVPHAFEDTALLFACSYGVVRLAQLVLLGVADRDDKALRRSVLTGLTGSTSIAIGLLVAASATDGHLQGALWVLALTLDMAGPFFFGSEGWKLEPAHFAERHGLIVLIAIGESIVAIGVGADAGVGTGVVVAAVLGIAVAGALWWLYFDVVALFAQRHLAQAPEGKERNEMARDSYSYLHFPLVAGIVLGALGLKKTIADVDDPLKLVPAVALLGGLAVYLLGHVAFRLRNVRTLNGRRLLAAVVLFALIPAAREIPALATLAIAAALLALLIAYETVRFADARDRIRHRLVE